MAAKALRHVLELHVQIQDRFNENLQHIIDKVTYLVSYLVWCELSNYRASILLYASNSIDRVSVSVLYSTEDRQTLRPPADTPSYGPLWRPAEK